MVVNSEPAQQHPRGGGASSSRQERGNAGPSGSHDDFFDVLSRVLSAMEGAVEAFHIIGDEDKDKARALLEPRISHLLYVSTFA